jgi:hypothetical protein
VSLLDPNRPTRRVRRALGLKTILGSDYPGEPFPELPEELRRFLSDANRRSSQAPKPDHPETGRFGNNPSAFTQKPLPETGIPIPVPPDPAGGLLSCQFYARNKKQNSYYYYFNKCDGTWR